jgi:hypothetical protein
MMIEAAVVTAVLAQENNCSVSGGEEEEQLQIFSESITESLLTCSLCKLFNFWNRHSSRINNWHIGYSCFYLFSKDITKVNKRANY